VLSALSPTGETGSERHLWPETIHVEGRDSNSIMREYFGTDDRDEEGARRLAALDDAIDAGNADEARGNSPSCSRFGARSTRTSFAARHA